MHTFHQVPATGEKNKEMIGGARKTYNRDEKHIQNFSCKT
jgi:hypothetical protein